jgi:4-amino-4-deoxy-L-arabinose transferase-like glycosyltransferase
VAKTWRLLFALGLIFGAYLLRRPWLERDIWNLDEGSTFTMAEQVLHGGVIYRDAADNRSPLVPYVKAAIFAVCGDWNAHAVHVAVAGMLGLTALLLWLLARRLGDEKTGVAGALFLSVLTFVLLGDSDTLSAHTEWFVIFFSALGYWLFAHAQGRPGFWSGAAVGVSFGLATLCKQPGVLDLGVTVVLLGLLWFSEPALRPARWRLLGGEITGFAATMAAMVAYFAWHRALPDLVLYAWTSNTKLYVPEVPFWDRMWAVRIPFQLAFWNMPVALATGIIGAVLLLHRVWRDLRRRPVAVPLLAWLILGWTAAGLVSTMISGRDFSHYSAQVIPGLCLACGWAVARLGDLVSRMRRGRIWAPLGWWGLIGLMLMAAAWDVGRRARALSKNDDSAKEIGRWAQRITAATDPIFVWGYFPEIYFFSQRLPSTRFIYTNYLTGMIPWTNLDMLVDTNYAVIPGAWKRFWEDFERRPPALIVDTLGARGYLKYPLYDQKKLWNVVVHDYAAVDDSTVGRFGFRFYRRLAPLRPEPALAEAVPNDGITLATSVTLHGGKVPVLTIHAPAGTTEVIVYQGSHPYRRLLFAGTDLCEAAFFVERDDLREGDTQFHLAVHGVQGWQLSRSIDLSAYRQPPPEPVRTGPKIMYGDRELLPVEGETLEDDSGFAYDNGRRWSAHAPSRFVYECPATMEKLTFSYGLDVESYRRGSQPCTNGVEVVVSLETPERGTTRLFRRELNPRAVGMDQNMQTSQVDIPAHTHGRLILQILPGPMNDSSFDWAYWSNLVAH